jgi:hypothetical protein
LSEPAAAAAGSDDVRGSRALDGVGLRRLFGLVLLTGVFLAMSSQAIAQTPPPDDVVEDAPAAVDLSVPIFPWASQEGGFVANWPEGLFLGMLGLFGAAVTLYLFAGEMLPSMGGKADLLVSQSEVANFKKLREEVLAERKECLQKNGTCSNDRITALGELYDDYAIEITRLEDAITRERKSLLRQAVPLYFLLGGLFASAFALNALQALVIGFGWTAIAERIGLKREHDALQKVRSTEVDELEREALKQSQRAEEQSQRVKALEATLDTARTEVTDIMRQLGGPSAASGTAPKGG